MNNHRSSCRSMNIETLALHPLAAQPWPLDPHKIDEQHLHKSWLMFNTARAGEVRLSPYNCCLSTRWQSFSSSFKSAFKSSPLSCQSVIKELGLRICADRAIAQRTIGGPGPFHGVHCKAIPQTRGAFTLLVILMETKEGGTPHIQFPSPAIHHPTTFLSFPAKDVLVSANNDFYRLYCTLQVVHFFLQCTASCFTL